MSTPNVRGRFAPSPTGPLHHGTLFTALLSWLSARSRGGEWIVRIEDLDLPRNVPGAEEKILRALERFGLLWDGTIVRQSERTELYESALSTLMARGEAFPCACSRADLRSAASAPARTDESDAAIYSGTCREGIPDGKIARSIRFRARGNVRFADRIAGVHEESLERSVGDFVIRRADGLFAYQLAVVVDDEKQGINEVVRGRDLLASTARQIALQRSLGYATPLYAHVPLLTDPSGAKLSKRGSSADVGNLSAAEVRRTLQAMLDLVGVQVEQNEPGTMLRKAAQSFSLETIPKTESFPFPAEPSGGRAQE